MTHSPATAAGAASRREERKAENRAKLMAAALTVFAEKGLGAATARDIVRETDLATGTFYNYFRDKEDVFRALLEESSERTREAAREVRLNLALTLEERVEVGFRTYFQMALENHELFEVFRRNSGVIASDQNLFAPAIGELIEDLGEWVTIGDIPPTDLEYLAAATAGLGFQMATYLIAREPPDVEGATRFCTKFFLGAVRALAEAPAQEAAAG